MKVILSIWDVETQQKADAYLLDAGLIITGPLVFNGQETVITINAKLMRMDKNFLEALHSHTSTNTKKRKKKIKKSKKGGK